MSKLPPFISNPLRNWRFWLMAAVIVGISWRLLDYLLRFPVWGDEASLGMNILRRNYLQLLAPLGRVQVCPLGFLWVSKWMIAVAGTSAFALRFFPLLCGITAVLIAWKIFHRVAGRKVGLLATAMLACSLATVRYSTDFKPYSTDLLVAMCYTGLGFWALRCPKDSRPLIYLIVFTPLALLFSFPGIFMAASVSAALLLRQIKHSNKTCRWLYAGFNVLTLGVFAVLFFGFMRGQMHHTKAGMDVYWRNAFPPLNWHIFGWLIQAHVSNMMSYPLGGKKGIALLITPLCIIGVWRLWHKRRRAELVLLVAPFILTFIAALLRAYPYGTSSRVQQHLVPSIMLLSSIGAVTLAAMAMRKHHSFSAWRAFAGSVVAALLMFAVICMVLDIHRPWVGPGPRMVRNLTRTVFRGADQHTEIIITNHKPDAFASEIAWYFNTQRHAYKTGVPLSAKALEPSARRLWVIHFGYKPVHHFNHTVVSKFTAGGIILHLLKQHDRIMRVGFSKNPPIVAQASLFAVKRQQIGNINRSLLIGRP
jgi:hypothetical protein